MKCQRCGINLTEAIKLIGLEATQRLHERAHLIEDNEVLKRRLHEFQVAARQLEKDWEHNIADAANAVTGLLHDGPLNCQHCNAILIDAVDECPACSMGPIMYLNEYKCHACGEEWEDTWDCGVDDECPKCGELNTPIESEPVEEDDE